MITYEVKYHYYQYNSGLADNGFYTRYTECATELEAKTLAERINVDAKTVDTSEEGDEELRNDLIPWSGFFKWARAYKVTKEIL